MESGFLFQNEFRAYPFAAGQTGMALPDEAIVEFGAVIGIGGGFTNAVDAVYLEEISRSGDRLFFRFRATNANLLGHPLIFERLLSDPEFTYQHTHSERYSSASSSATVDCPTAPRWEGFLITGKLASLADLISDGDALSGSLNVEPALVQNLSDVGVSSVNLANFNRTKSSDPKECSSSLGPEDEQIIVNQVCLTGDLVFKNGYNLVINLGRTDNRLTFTGAVGDGAGETCSDIPLYAGETPRTGRRFLDGALGCGEVLRSINGVKGRAIRLAEGDGVTIIDDEIPHTIIIDINLRGLAVCFEPVVSSSSISLTLLTYNTLGSTYNDPSVTYNG